jgi:hypothetical protein
MGWVIVVDRGGRTVRKSRMVVQDDRETAYAATVRVDVQLAQEPWKQHSPREHLRVNFVPYMVME